MQKHKQSRDHERKFQAERERALKKAKKPFDYSQSDSIVNSACDPAGAFRLLRVATLTIPVRRYPTKTRLPKQSSGGQRSKERTRKSKLTYPETPKAILPTDSSHVRTQRPVDMLRREAARQCGPSAAGSHVCGALVRNPLPVGSLRSCRCESPY
jgi:hypothetical protein